MLTIKNNEEVYTTPVCTMISVKVQGVLCVSPGDPGTANGGYSDNPLDDLGD